jgi:hypothetical protein
MLNNILFGVTVAPAHVGRVQGVFSFAFRFAPSPFLPLNDDEVWYSWP